MCGALETGWGFVVCNSQRQLCGGQREGSRRATYHEARGGTGLPEEEHAGWYRQAIEDTGQVHKVQGRRP